MLTTYLIDLDDTILDFKKTQELALKGIYEDNFANVESWNCFKSSYGQINHGLWNRLAKSEINQKELRILRFKMLLNDLKVTESYAEQIAAEYESRMAEIAEFCAGGFELAETAAKSGELIIATNGLANVQRRRIAKAGLADLATLIWISEEVDLTKPDPSFFTEALRAVGKSKEGSIAIGDSLVTDGECAERAGIPFWWINWNNIATKSVVENEFSSTFAAYLHLAGNEMVRFLGQGAVTV